MTRSQQRRIRKYDRQDRRAAEIKRMQAAARAHEVGPWDPGPPQRTGARKRRRKVLFGGLGQRQRRGYLRRLEPVGALEVDLPIGEGDPRLARFGRAA